MDRVTGEASEFLLQAEDERQFQYRKGFLDGHDRTKRLLDTLISLSETGDREWMEQEIRKAVEPLRTLLLGSQEQVEVETEEQEREGLARRVSRVLKAREENKHSIGRNSTQR